ncbi:MAG: hypothetical protein ABIA97_05905 [Candidatus Omnitrophota bacterium]
MKSLFFIHNLRVELTTNSKFIYRLIKNNLSLFNPRARGHLIRFNIQELDNYRKIPLGDKNKFLVHPIYQYEFQEELNSIIEAGARTIRVVISLENDLISGYVVKPDIIEEDLLFELIFFQPLRLLLKLHDVYLLHSSAVSQNGKCILFSGSSGSGKSTLSLVLVNKGFNYLAEDDVILKSNGHKVECFSFPTKIRIKEHLLKYFPKVRNKLEKSCDGKGKYKLNPKKIWPQTIINKARPFLLIFPQYRKNSKVKVSVLPKTEALSKLLKENFICYEPTVKFSQINTRHFKVFSDLVNQCRTLKLIYSDKELRNIPAIIDKLL